jgi:hypothetical protein
VVVIHDRSDEGFCEEHGSNRQSEQACQKAPSRTIKDECEDTGNGGNDRSSVGLVIAVQEINGRRDEHAEEGRANGEQRLVP